MLPSLSGLTLHDEEPTGALGGPSGGITKSRDDRKADQARRKLIEAREAAEKEEKEKARYQQMGRQAAAAAVDKKEPPGYPWKLMEARARERNEAAARLAAEQARDGAVAARDREAAARRAAEQANQVLQSKVRDAEARQKYAQEKLIRTPSPQRTPVHDDDVAPQPDSQLPGRSDSQGTDDGDAPMEAAAQAEAAEATEAAEAAEAAEAQNDEFDSQGAGDGAPSGEVVDEYPPLRGDRSLLQPSTYNGIEELRQHLEFASQPTPSGASPNLEDVLRIGFEKFMDYASVKRGTKGRAEISPAAMENSTLADRRKAWEEFTAARDIVLNDDAESRRWRRLRTSKRTSGIPLENVRWKTEQYLMRDILDFADRERGGKGVALEYFKDAQKYPAIQEELYKALQERQRSDGRTIFVRTKKVQAVYEAALAFCQADLKYELTLARRRTWAALYQFLEASMLQLPRDSEGNLKARKDLWEHAINDARKKLHCFPPDAPTFERLQLLMEKQVTNNIRWQYPYYNAYELSRDDGIFGREFKFWISKGPTVSLVQENGARKGERMYYIQHVHIPWEWMKTFLKKTATNLARGLGDFCGSRFLVDKKYEEAKEKHDSEKPDAPKALQTLPDPRITKVAPLTLKEHRRLQSELSNRGFDHASRGAQIMLGTMHSNYHTTSVEPMSIGQNRRYGSMVPEDYEFYDPFFEDQGKTWEPATGWEPPNSWRPDIRTNRRRAFLRMHKKYWEYAKQQEYAQTFIAAFEASEKELYLQAWKERELVGELFDPNECLRKTPKRTAFAFSLTSGFNVAPHDDSGAALEHIVFTYPAHAELPLGHNPMFVASGVIMVLPGPVDKGPPGDELAGIRACLCTVPGHDVHHGSMPTWTASYYKMMLEGGKLDELTLPKHFKCGSALITKVVPQMVAQRKDKKTGDWIEFKDCEGLIDKLNDRYANDPNMNVAKLMQLLYEGNKPYRDDPDPLKNDPPETKGKVWSFDVRTQWLASYPNETDRKEMKRRMMLAYGNVYGLTPKQQEEVKEQEEQQEEEQQQRQREEEEEERKREEEERRRREEEARPESTSDQSSGSEEDEDEDEDEDGNDDDDSGGGDGGGDDSGGGGDDSGGGGGGGGDASEPEKGQSDPMDDNESGKAPPPIDGGLSDDSDDNVPLDQRSTTPTPPAQAGPSAAPMDVEGDGATKKRRRSKPPNRLGNYADDDDLVEINGRKVKDLIHWIKDQNLGNMKERAENEKERKHQLAKYERKRAKAQEEVDRNREDSAAKEALVLAQEAVQAVEKHIEVAERKLMEYDAQHPR